MNKGFEVIELRTTDPCAGDGKVSEVWVEEDKGELCVDSTDASLVTCEV